jgi:hypothetical protein
MLVQTNSYIVPQARRADHDHLMKRFRQAYARLGCEHFEVFEQTVAGWGSPRGDVRCVQIIRFRDRQHHHAVQEAERKDEAAQQVIFEFCKLINYDQQLAGGLFVSEFYLTPGTDGVQP